MEINREAEKEKERERKKEGRFERERVYVVCVCLRSLELDEHAYSPKKAQTTGRYHAVNRFILFMLRKKHHERQLSRNFLEILLFGLRIRIL